MRFVAVTLILCGFAAPLAAQSFEAQGPPCGYVFPAPMGAGGDPEGVSWNGVPMGAVALPPSVNATWPCAGVQNLVVEGGLPEEPYASSFSGVPPAALTVSPEVYVPIPAAAPTVSFCWNGGIGDAYGNGTFNDGFMIDVVDAANTQLAVLVFDDSTGTGTAGIGGFGMCSTCVAEEMAPAGIKLVTAAPLPAGAAFLRVSAWNGMDDVCGGVLVVDDIIFGGPPAFDHSIVCVPVPPTDSDVVFTIVGGTPGSLCYIAMAAASTGVAPAGWFYGIDIAYPELVAQIAFGLPFNYVLDASGGASYTFPVLGALCPLGIPIDCVVLEFSAGPGFFSAAGTAKSIML